MVGAAVTALCALGVALFAALALRWVVRRSEERGAARALREQERKEKDARDELAEKILGGDGAHDAHFRVRRPGVWGEGPPPGARA